MSLTSGILSSIVRGDSGSGFGPSSAAMAAVGGIGVSYAIWNSLRASPAQSGNTVAAGDLSLPPSSPDGGSPKRRLRGLDEYGNLLSFISPQRRGGASQVSENLDRFGSDVPYAEETETASLPGGTSVAGCGAIEALMREVAASASGVEEPNRTPQQRIVSETEVLRELHSVVALYQQKNQLHALGDFVLRRRHPDGATLLHISVSKGWTNVVNLLVDCEDDELLRLPKLRQSGDADGSTPLHVACRLGFRHMISMLVGPRHSSPTSSTSPPRPSDGVSTAPSRFMSRVDENHLFLCQGTDRRGSSPLHVAAAGGFVDIVQELVFQHNHAVEVCDQVGATPLLAAALHNQPDVVQFLIEQAAVRPDATTQKGFTALHLACEAGHDAVVQRLLSIPSSCDCLLNFPNRSGATPLFIAAQHGHAQCVSRLLSARCEIECMHQCGATALYVAAQNGHVGIVRDLLAAAKKRGKTHSIKGRRMQGYTALHAAAEAGHDDVVDVLIRLGGFDTEALDKPSGGGTTALHLAAHAGHLSTVETLLRHKALVDAPGRSGFTALHLACQAGHLEIVNYLVKCGGAHKEAATHARATPLYVAAQNGHVAVVQLLLSFGAYREAVHESGATPLYAAVCNGHSDVVAVLLAAGCRKISLGGVSMCDAARSEGFSDIAMLVS